MGRLRRLRVDPSCCRTPTPVVVLGSPWSRFAGAVVGVVGSEQLSDGVKVLGQHVETVAESLPLALDHLTPVARATARSSRPSASAVAISPDAWGTRRPNLGRWCWGTRRGPRGGHREGRQVAFEHLGLPDAGAVLAPTVIAATTTSSPDRVVSPPLGGVHRVSGRCTFIRTAPARWRRERRPESR